MSNAVRCRVPSYRRHKPTNQAAVTIDGRDFYLGRWNSADSKAEYDRLISEWTANGRVLPPDAGLTITELVAAYGRFAEGYYRKDGKPTGSMPGITIALRMLRLTYGHTLAGDFGPLALQALQHKLVVAGKSRVYINDTIDRIRRCFKWGVSQQLVPVAVHQALVTVPGLRRGRTDAREPEPVRPVEQPTVNATLPHLSPTVADMVRFQRLTGCRPHEVCILRPCDVDRSAEVWRYAPASHKTEHFGKQRAIFIGPKAQSVLLSYLLRDAECYCFSPAESDARRKAELRAARKTRVQPSQLCRQKPHAKRKPGKRFTTASYRRAIARACEQAFPAPEGLTDEERMRWRRDHQWHPNQLRHTAATEIRAKYGLEAAQVVLGHASANVSEIYAERDHRKAAAIMREVG